MFEGDGDVIAHDGCKNCDIHHFDENGHVDHTHQGNDFEKQTKSDQDEDEKGKAAKELRLTARTLWKTGLEIFIHQLLYRRGIYPRDTFFSTRFVGVECKINNNPGVLIYIAEALKEIIPGTFGDDYDDRKKSCDPGRCRLKEILIEIYDQATEITYERFSLSFSSPGNAEGNIEDDTMSAGLCSSFSRSFSFYNTESDLSDYVIEEIEKGLRDLVCSTGKLERPRSLVWDDSISFKISLKINQRCNHEAKTVLDSGLEGTKWSKTASASNFPTGNRVLFNLSNFACQFQYRLISVGDKPIETP